MILAYMRISTQKIKQTTDRQKITLEKYSKENNFEFDDIYEERVSGTIKADNRPQYIELKKRLRKGDILVITDIDRIGRDADDVIIEFKTLKAMGVIVVALDTPYLKDWDKVNDSSLYDMIADIFITLKAHMAQQEREKTTERINQGLAAARAKGKKLGRPKAEVPDSFTKEYTKFKNGEYGNISTVNFSKMLGIGRSTFYKYRDLLEQ